MIEIFINLSSFIKPPAFVKVTHIEAPNLEELEELEANDTIGIQYWANINKADIAKLNAWCESIGADWFE